MSTVIFKDKDGNTIALDSSITMEQLVRQGIAVFMAPKGTPIQRREFVYQPDKPTLAKPSRPRDRGYDIQMFVLEHVDQMFPMKQTIGDIRKGLIKRKFRYDGKFLTNAQIRNACILLSKRKLVVLSTDQKTVWSRSSNPQ